MTLKEFVDFSGEVSSLSDLDILPLMYRNCPPTDALNFSISLFRSVPLSLLQDVAKECLCASSRVSDSISDFLNRER